jgi:hypothetical protein
MKIKSTGWASIETMATGKHIEPALSTAFPADGGSGWEGGGGCCIVLKIEVRKTLNRSGLWGVKRLNTTEASSRMATSLDRVAFFILFYRSLPFMVVINILRNLLLKL